ncbi:hypothetical protein VOLCADRAFT_87286 [Volvox carteri f. nagariensis]|uniref:3'-5' exonuclease domain-containing protein n=1 Tax=Volvox carteri f. nagariensis TaxID=3068 RepID=D8TKY0_VOLCA|nr:uncharacterized protein VOLCADRAFT_87286 [Volvox carteri f. nagariensis]EFJ51774.1 hypothetical protein VOLCADRAFT_87286 [Volvox carteri f. nagariensis]|eukprot:XP_002947184.1 hypothetical protein VOLCADRAFT_87286 [Volvox carteri f. nagariensis]
MSRTPSDTLPMEGLTYSHGFPQELTMSMGAAICEVQYKSAAVFRCTDTDSPEPILTSPSKCDLDCSTPAPTLVWETELDETDSRGSPNYSLGGSPDSLHDSFSRMAGTLTATMGSYLSNLANVIASCALSATTRPCSSEVLLPPVPLPSAGFHESSSHWSWGFSVLCIDVLAGVRWYADVEILFPLLAGFLRQERWVWSTWSGLDGMGRRFCSASRKVALCGHLRKITCNPTGGSGATVQIRSVRVKGPSCGCSCRDAGGGGGRGHLSSCSAVVEGNSSDDGTTADNRPSVPAAAAAVGATGNTTGDDDGGSAAEVASHTDVSTGLSALQRQVDSLAAAVVFGKAGKAAAKAALERDQARLSRLMAGTAAASHPNVQGPPPKRAKPSLSAAATSLGAGLEAAAEAKAASQHERTRPSRAVTGIAGTSRPALQVPGPPPKQASLSLSAAATSSLGVGLTVSAAAVMQPPPKAAKTTVPPCDPARGCKARLQEAAAATAAALKRARSGSSLAEEGSNGGGSSPEPGQLAAAAAAGVTAAAAAAAAAGPGTAATMDPPWCGFEVTLPAINWQAVFDEPPGALQRFSLAKGYEKLLLPQGVVTYVVENERHFGEALRNLKAGMQDRLIAIDLEWRPETVSGRVSPVALLQLSSASVCVVVRTCCMGYDLPPALRSFLKDPAHVLLGFGWDSADELKMQGTFGIGRADFRRFLDLQEVAASLGYHGFGLSRLSQLVLGLPLHKSKAISRSNWAAPQLTSHQLKYASLDVLVAGQLFRALRLWHSSPSPCADCRSHIGELQLPGLMRCGNPTCTARPATNLQHHRDHCAATGHPARFAACSTCGRVYELGGPS